mmetsp:Transcript_22191/g.37947  ORF Transcript_22191/g.37947 Transcript_22191/m.37947 type:complete len:483 (-) Transcript_22191:265-1713(-)|eukprot:CAMPEP_0119116502 /NCGR_PEP_ID=MMETSP1180-20130426/52317_1 /TAXON_ID=3052 ORGANISM="Chlamydomonas cf sp, Strain CCMP681" /NCGR_SAMPLE_ID=MMETSP1180 /ASSEMBLY_ACC=CAM_ASM_000741 /LENGTH=482 /DNA_ID=CAMNT_0007105655 /DNA_START=1791 /DNA_END=3239 /DNA_ORIENTATION=-
MGTVGEFTVSSIAMDEDKREKSTVDLVKLTADIAVQLEVAKAGKLHEAVEALLNLEKMSRLAEDSTATKACCTAVLDVIFQAKQWKLLEEHILLLAKRRSQLKHAIQAFVRQTMTFIDSAPDTETKVSLIKTLQAVTEGKIFVEIERARLTRRLAAMRESEGKIAEAADILQEVPVETFGAMAKTEKIAFILEQVRLCLDKQDFIRAQILSRKVSTRAFVEKKGEQKGDIGIEGTAIEAPDVGVPGLPELKLSYYQLMIRYHTHYNNYLEVTRCYKSIYEVDSVQADPAQWAAALKRISWYIVLAPAYSTEEGSSSDRTTLLTSTLQDKKLGELPDYKNLLTTFNTHEIVRWPAFHQTYQAEIAAQPDVFSDPKRLEDLKLRVNEHNVMVVARYYTRISTDRLAELLDLSADGAEALLSTMVVSKAVAAKIDRPAFVVIFGADKEPEELLNNWAGNIGKLLGLVEKSVQQISKECMLHKVVL